MQEEPMPSVDLKLLVGRLNDVCRRTLEAAAGRTLSRSHYNVEIEHWLLQLLDQPRCDVVLVLQRAGVDMGALQAELNTALDRMATGNGRAPSLAPELVATSKEAWLFASMVFDDQRVRSGHLLWAMLADEIVGARLCGVAPQLRRVVPDTLRRDFADLVAGSTEAPMERSGEAVAKPAAQAAGGALDRYTVDLTAQARAGAIDPILGRDSEIRQVVDILTRRRQNNPILTGEAGVGKTAVVEGLALRIAAGDVPAPLAQVSLRTLDLGLLQAGAGIKGEFENRLRSVIDETQSSRQPVILFIDEAHMLIGAGNGAGQGDAANLLKPALARGALRVIAATTWAEYKKYFEKDAALTRRFQVVKVEEPSEAVAIDMVRGLLPTLEAHHGVRILDEAAEASVRLSARYIPSRQLPDKAVSLIDTACARVATSQAATPGAVEDRRRRIGLIDVATRLLAREALSGADHAARLATLEAERAEVQAELQRLEARWADEGQLVADLQALRDRVEAAADPAGLRDRVEAAADPARLQGKLADVTAALQALQGEQPLIFPSVDRQAVAAIVEGWTGIPAGRMQADEIRTVLGLREALGRRVVGQDKALEAVAQAIRTSRAGLTDPRKPIGVFLMVGTSGVGKTETALALAELLYGGEANLTTINMSEFKEEHKVSLLMGSPPGYVGYGEGGVLTEAVRRRPYSVILLDEMEKAHPGVQDVFYQVFDKGTMKDGEGRDVDFRNSVIIMTSNAGSEVIASLFADPETAPAASDLSELVRPELGKHFKPAFLGRVTVVPYVPLAPDTMRRIAQLQIDRIARRVQEHFGAAVEYGPELIDLVTTQATDASAGARGIEAMLTRTLLPDLSAEVLARLANGQTVQRVVVEAGADDRPRCIVY
jgi:type VI secretion system protein VasG